MLTAITPDMMVMMTTMAITKELRETNGLLRLKIAKLEQLLRLKDAKIQRLAESGELGGALP